MTPENKEQKKCFRHFLDKHVAEKTTPLWWVKKLCPLQVCEKTRPPVEM